MTVRPLRERLLRRGKARAGGGASEQVAVEIQHHIHERGLGADDFLGREEDLASEFGVSRPTVREALKLLASGNLIRATKGPGGGIFVAGTADEGLSRSVSDALSMMLETGAMTLDELMDARLLLEVPLAGLAALHADAAAVTRLREAVNATPGAGGDPRSLAVADVEIHRAVASAGGNRMVQVLTGWVAEVAQPELIDVLEPEVVDSALLRHHQALLAAVVSGEPSGAERAMKSHLVHVRDVLRRNSGEASKA